MVLLGCHQNHTMLHRLENSVEYKFPSNNFRCVCVHMQSAHTYNIYGILLSDLNKLDDSYVTHAIYQPYGCSTLVWISC